MTIEKESKSVKIKDAWKFLQENGMVFLLAGGVCLIAAAVWYLIGRAFDAWVQGLGIGGLIAIALYALLRPQDIRAAFTGRSVRYGSNAVVLSIAVIGIVVLLNYLSNRYYKRFDVTVNKLHSLSEQSRRVLADLDQDIDIIGFYPNGQDKDSFEKWLAEYQAHTDRIRYQSHDPILEPGLAEQYQWSAYGGGLLVQRSAQKVKVTTADEQNITSAILRASRSTPKVIYFLTGHGERSPQGYEPQDCSQAATFLRSYNYDLHLLNLAVTTTVPADAAALAIVGPQTALLGDEKARLTAYLQSGGKVLIMLDPTNKAGLDEVLDVWGVSMPNSLVLDARQGLSGDPRTPVMNSYLYGQVTKDLPMIAMPLAGPITQTRPIADVTFSPLAQSSTQSWAKDLSGRAESEQIDLTYLPGQDRLGPFTLIASVEAASTISPALKTRLVLIGDSDLISDQVIAQVPNGQMLLLNAINWLAEEENLIAIGPKTNAARQVYLNTLQQGAVCFGTIIFLPAVILLAGLAVWLKRR